MLKYSTLADEILLSHTYIFDFIETIPVFNVKSVSIKIIIIGKSAQLAVMCFIFSIYYSSTLVTLLSTLLNIPFVYLFNL